MSRAWLTLASSACLVLGLVDLAWIDFRVAPVLFGAQSANPVGTVATPWRSVHAAASPPTTESASLTPLLPAEPSAQPLEAVVVLFGPSSYQVALSDINRLKAIAERLRRDPHAAAVIEGHTDSTGSEDFNQTLSARRAEQVAQLLAAFGVETTRVQTRAFGATHPAIHETSADGLRLNRRVEIYLR